jgi:hypothetical protein
MPDPFDEAVQASLSIDGSAPVTVSCVRRTTGGGDLLLLRDPDKRPITGVNGKMIYGDEELKVHFVELEEACSAGVWEVLTKKPK